MGELLKALEELHKEGIIFADIDLNVLTDNIEIKERIRA